MYNRQVTARLPRLLTPLVGREAALQEVRDWLDRERLVLLVGAGGIGKTRLAIEAVRELDREVCFVDLATVNGPDAAVTSIAAALGISEGGERPIQDAVVDALVGAEMVLVLDNCEHVAAVAARFVEHLLSSCERVRVLATSRETLGIAGEVAWRVPSLPVPPIGSADPASFDAVRLFVDRARRVRPTVVVNEAFLTAAGEICRRLDGIPLAIELAAAAVRVLPPDRIVSELDHRFAVLTGGPRTAVSRQQTLQASVDWSYDQLTDVERQVFRRLGVFTGAFPLEAAEAVGASDGLTGWAVFDVVSRLVDKSLVTHDEDTGWYRLLETLRLFAIDRCHAAGELVAVRDVHAQWWHHWLLARGPHWYAEEVLDAIDQAYPNLRVALEWLASTDPDAAHDVVDALASYWYGSGLFTDALALSDDLLDGSRTPRPERWARTTAALVTIYAIARPGELTALAEQANLIARDASDELSVLRCDSIDLRGAPDPAGLGVLLARAVAAGDLYLAARIRYTVSGWNYIKGADPSTWLDTDAVPDALLAPSVNHPIAFRCRALCIEGDYRGAWTLQRRFIELTGRWTPFTLLYTLLDGVWFPLLLGEGEAVAEASAALKAWRRDWGRQAPLVSLLADLPDLLAGFPPPPQVLDLWNAPQGILLAFPPWSWMFLDVLGPPPRKPPIAGLPSVVTDALEAMRLFAAAENAAAEPHIARVAVLRREDQYLWLLMLACVSAELGAHARALRLFGALDRFRDESGVTWMPALLRSRRQGALDACASTLGEEGARRVLSEGAGLTIVEAAAYGTRNRGERGRPAAGWDSLTPTERRVADKAAAGRTNVQIAAELFMSTATVKTHLTHIYTKLGLSNRTELAAAAVTRTDL